VEVILGGSNLESLEAKVVKSLDGENNELFSFIPYLLQDLWEIGSSPEVIIDMVKKHIGKSNISVLDLGCGKGAVSVKLANSVGCQVKGIDAVEDFIDYARNKAEQFRVNNICKFEIGDIRECLEKNHDLVIFGACGDVLGDLAATITILKKMVRNNGFIIIDDAYCEDDKKINGYLTRDEVIRIFKQNKVELIQEDLMAEEMQENINEINNQNIIQRANELKKKYPDKSKIFDNYVKKQLEECEVMENEIKCVTWLLRKVE
jgi:2-polyprenyl-3-methyl-5-hydroxy-6-metoxy-1,4-benzoquinol methylase